MRIQDIYRALNELGLVRSQMEFSRIWLGKSARYYSSLLSRQQEPSVGTLTALLFRLRNTLAHTSEVQARSTVSMLIERLNNYIALRVISGKALSVQPWVPAVQ